MRDLAPDNLEVRAKLGLILLASAQFTEARREAVAILEKSPNNDQALLLLAEASRNQRDIDDAERRLQSIDAKDKAGYQLALAGLSLRKKDVASAESAVQRALALDSSSIEAHLALGKIYWSRNDLKRADQEFTRAAQLAAPRSVARLICAEFKARTGALIEAKARLHEITRHAPDFLPTWRLLAQIALNERQFDESLALVENVLLRDPMNLEALLLQSQVLFAKGDVERATENLKDLDANFPKVPAIKYQLARAYLKDDDTVQATTLLNQAIAINPDYAEAILLLNEINLQKGDAQPVVTSMLDLLKRRGKLVQAQILLAQAYQILGRPGDATGIFKKQIEDSPHDAQPRVLLGLVYRKQNRINEARRAFEDAQRLGPANLLVVSQLIDLDIQTKDFDSALRKATEETKRMPGSPGAHFLEAKVYAAQAQWDLAETSLRNSLALDPGFTSAYDLLLFTFVASNQLPEAVELLEEWLLKKPDNIRALMLLGQFYDRLNEFTKARDAYERLLSIKADSPHAQNNLAVWYTERLGELEKATSLRGALELCVRKTRPLPTLLGGSFTREGTIRGRWLCLKRPRASYLITRRSSSIWAWQIT